jgi:epoxyqueuosine reductase
VDFFDHIVGNARKFGLNLIAALPVARYDHAAAEAYRADAIFSGCRSIVLIGNGGVDFWRAFKTHVAANQGWLERENPLDDFTREVINREIVMPIQTAGARCIAVFPFGSSGRTLNFMQLAMLSGLAGPSILGVVVHPVFGPWIAFRAALLLDREVDHPGDALNFDPCPTCITRSCISACPALAVSFPSGWDIPRCLMHRVEAHPDCSYRCHARVACVLGPSHRYPDDELAYHQTRALLVMRPFYEKMK